MRKCKCKINGKEIQGLFHKWGSEAIEGNVSEENIHWTVGIVELHSGRVMLVDPTWITFLDSIEARDKLLEGKGE